VRVALFGGSFNPPHVAHVEAAKYLLGPGGFDRVLVIPVYEHAFDKDLAPFEDRVALCQLAFEGIAGVEISRIEERLEKPNRTLSTVRALRAMHPDWELRLVLGADVRQETDRWHRFDEVVRLAPVFPLGRVGFEGDEGPSPVLPEVSSTEVRELLASGTEDARLSTLAPAAVIEYARRRGLYGCQPGPRTSSERG
jgi:nicotinate-nucleotide adenylyltransferase